MRLAWWSPWPPQRSGIAGRSAEVVPRLAARGHAIDVFVDAKRVRVQGAPDQGPEGGAWRLLDAHDFIWRHRRSPYDLCVYQVGNSHLHRHIWAYLFTYPGLTVLHDGRVHHARAEALLFGGRTADYRAEFAWSHPDVDPAGANFAAMRLDGPFFYQWPMLRGVLEASRLVAAHSPGVVGALNEASPGLVTHIALGEGNGDLDVAGARREFRRQHAIPDDAVIFGTFGGLTAEKHIVEILSAFQATRPWLPGARLLLAGAADPWLGLEEHIADRQIADAVIRLPAASDDEFDRAIAATDVVLSLRWPTALETSGPWVRSLALARATVILDVPHQGHIPALDPRTWHRHEPCEDLSLSADDHAVTVSLDLLDLEHSLRAAMRRLGTDAALRTRLGAAARRWWEREHTVERMVDDYERAFTEAVSRPLRARPPGWPPHLANDPATDVRRVLDHDAWNDAAISDRLSALGL